MAVPEELKNNLYGLAHQAGGFQVLDTLPLETVYKMCNHRGYVGLVFRENNALLIQDINPNEGFTMFNKDFVEIYSYSFLDEPSYVWGLTVKEKIIAYDMALGEIAYILYKSHNNPLNSNILLLVAV